MPPNGRPAWRLKVHLPDVSPEVFAWLKLWLLPAWSHAPSGVQLELVPPPSDSDDSTGDTSSPPS